TCPLFSTLSLQPSLLLFSHRPAPPVIYTLSLHDALPIYVISAVGEGIIVLDREWRVEFMNPEAERLLGWTEAELFGKPAHASIHFRRCDGSPFPACECPAQTLTHTGERYSSDNEHYVRKNGEMLPASAVVTRLVDQAGAVRYIKAFQDRTQRKRDMEALEHSRRQLRELSAFQQQVREEERAHI